MDTQTGPRSGGATAAVATLAAVQFVDVLGGTVVITALPAVLADLDAPPSAAGPVVTGYAVFFGALLLLGARLGDRFGHRRVLATGVTLFGVASVLAALAPAAPVLVAARCLLGAAAAVSVPPALRLLTAATEDEDARRRALAVWSAAGAAAGATGFLLGGVLSDLTGWRSLFWLNVPLAAGLLVAVSRWVPDPPRVRSGRLDLRGAALLAAGVAALVLGASVLEQAGSRGRGALLVLAGAALLAAFARAQRRAADPLLPPAAARLRRLRTGAATAFLNTATTSSAATLATLHLQEERGFGPTATGALLLPFSLCVVLGATAAAPALRRLGPRTVAGLGLAAIGGGNAVLLAAETSPAWIGAGMAVAGAGIGLSSVASTAMGTDVPEALQGAASGVLNTAAQLGTALGVAAVLLVARATAGSDLPLAGTALGWAAAAAGAATAAVVLLGRVPRRGDR
ncbi:MFS transporter [Geodermatophilus sp. CPCC 206100]|uniref:MFS transporter n=1 Tax=Geodermatophilus sp. CPCC 206100 TaxID=3020054 RepID=UPI003AFF7147